jgi:hypothetical protein
MKALRIALAIPTAFLAAAFAMRLLLAHAPASIANGVAQPIAVVTAWNAFGAAALCVLLLAAAAATAAYARVCDLRAAWRSPVVVAVMVALALACAWCVPVVFSSDVYAYAVYGELARLGSDPYAHQPLPAGNAIFDAAVVQWGNPPPTCVYGPAFVWIAAAIAGAAAAFRPVVALDGLRVLSSGALILCTFLASAAYRGKPSERLAAAAMLGLNPVVIWCAAEGHNDALTLAVVLAGFACARRGYAGAGAFLAACSGAMKLPGIVAALPLALANRRAWPGAVAGIAATLAISIPMFESVATRLAPRARYAPEASFQAIVESFARLTFAPNGSPAVAWSLAIVAAVACALVALAMLRRSEPEGWTYLAASGWLLVPNPYPWYGIWLVAIAAAAPGTRGARALLALTLASMLRYFPDAAGTPSAFLSLCLGVVATLPFLLLLRRKPSGIINGSP